MKIKKLTLQNYRAFKSFECDFESDLTVLVGLNGQGKTSVLDAIAVAYGQFVGGFGTGKDKGISTSDIHLAKLAFKQDVSSQNPRTLNYTMEHQFPVKINANSYKSDYPDYPFAWQRSRNTLKGRATQVKELSEFAQRLQKDVQDNVSVILPLISYYGTGRLWSQQLLITNNNPQSRSRLDGYKNCLDPESPYNDFSRWLRSETLACIGETMELIHKMGIDGLGVTGSRAKLLDAITKAVDTVLEPSGWDNLRYSTATEEIIATHEEQGDVPVSQLSDGVRNMIGLVADVAYRAVRLNPHLLENAVLKTPGIVLIDEVDMHLHPEWQQLILQELNEAFPQIQFIVTTHSPQVLSTVKREKIRLLTSENGVGTASLPLGPTYAESSSDLLERVMNVDSKPPLLEVEQYRTYLKLVENGEYNSEEALQLRKELESAFAHNPEYLRKADLSIKRQEFLAR